MRVPATARISADTSRKSLSRTMKRCARLRAAGPFRAATPCRKIAQIGVRRRFRLERWSGAGCARLRSCSCVACGCGRSAAAPRAGVDLGARIAAREITAVVAARPSAHRTLGRPATIVQAIRAERHVRVGFLRTGLHRSRAAVDCMGVEALDAQLVEDQAKLFHGTCPCERWGRWIVPGNNAGTAPPPQLPQDSVCLSRARQYVPGAIGCRRGATEMANSGDGERRAGRHRRSMRKRS
jgi:hypothetical protein